METALLWIAGITTGFFIIRLVLMFIGMDGAADAADAADALDSADALSAHDAMDAADFKVFSLMTVVVTFMMGSWLSLLFLSLDWSEWIAVPAGYAAGFVCGIGVGYAIFSMRKLEHDGTIREFEAEGLKGTCYVKIPVAGEGKGQVQVTVSGRLLTFDAISDGPEIPSFKPIVVMARIDEKTLRVCPTE